jgi:hypothetical protein
MLRPQHFLAAFLVLTVALTVNAQESHTGPKTVKLKRGQTLSLSLLTPIDSGSAKVGDEVALKLLRPLVADGATVLPVDRIVLGTVTKVKRAGKNCSEGSVAWKFQPITTAKGDRIKVQKVYSYPFNPGNVGDPAWVPLDTPLTKVGHGVKTAALIAVLIPFSPLLVPMGVAMSSGGRCRGEAGNEQELPQGLGELAAVSKDVRVTPLP